MTIKQNKILKITLVRSLIGRKKSHKACVRGLGGLRKINQTVRLPATPAHLGMIKHAGYLLRVEDCNEIK